MMKFLLIVYFHGTKNYPSIILFLNSVGNIQCTILHILYIYIYIVYVPQYSTLGSIETMREYLETRSVKSISSKSLCNLATIFLKSKYFENKELKYHQNHQKEVLLLRPSSFLHLLICLWQGYKREFFKTVSSNLSSGYDILKRFFYLDLIPKI